MKGIITHKYNWDDYGYLMYLDKLSPILYNGKTLLLDEGVPYQPNRPTLYNRCLLGDGTSTVDLSAGIVGTLTLKGWVKYAPVKLNTTSDLWRAWLTSRATVTDNGDSFTVTRINGGNAEEMYAQVINSDLGWLSKMNNSSVYITYEAKSDDNLWITLNVNGANSAPHQLNSNWQLTTEKITALSSGNGAVIVIDNDGSIYNTGTSVEVRNVKIWWENDGTENLEWAYVDDIYVNSNNVFTLFNNTYIKSIERYDNGVKRDTAVCEEGAGTTLYTNIGDELPITTGEINLVRVTQDDAPLLPESGDYVGYGVAYYFNDIDSYLTTPTITAFANDGDYLEFGLSLYNSTTSTRPYLLSGNSPYNFNTLELGNDTPYLRMQLGAGNTWTANIVFDSGWNVEDIVVFRMTRGTSTSILVYVKHKDGSEYSKSYTKTVGADDFDVRPFRFNNFFYYPSQNRYELGGLVYFDNNGTIYDPVNNPIPETSSSYELMYIPKKSDANTTIKLHELSYTGRKDQPLQVGGVAVNLDATATLDTEDCNKHIEYGTGVVATLGTIIAAFGEVNDGTLLVPSDLGIDGDKVFNNRSDGQAIKLARIDWSNGVQSVYLGGRDNNGNEIASDKMYDASQVGGETATIVYDTQDYHTSQKYYNHWALYGASQNKIWFKSNKYDVNDFTAVGFGSSVTTYRDTLATNKFQYAVPNNFVSGLPLTYSGEEAGLRNDYILLLTDGHSAALNKLSLNGVINNASYLLDFETSTNANFSVSIYDTYLHDTLNALLPTLSDPLGDLQTIAPFNFYSLDSIMTWWDNNPSLRFNVDNLLNEYVKGLTYEIFYDYYAANSIGTSSFDTYDGLILIFSATYNGARQQINGSSFKDNGQNVGGGNTLTGRIYWYSNNISLKYLTVNAPISRITGTSIEWVKIYDGFVITEDVLVGLTDASNTDSRFGEPNEYPFGTHLNNTQKQYVQLPPFKMLEYAYQSNEEYWRDKVDSQGNAVLDRHLVPISLEHSDRNFPAFVYKTGDEWNLGTYINDKTITQVLGSSNVPSDFTISANKITAAADVSFAALVLDNGDKLIYTGNNSYLLQNTSGVNHGTLTTANVADNQGVQDVFDVFEDGFADEGYTPNIRNNANRTWYVVTSPYDAVVVKGDDYIQVTGAVSSTATQAVVRESSGASLDLSLQGAATQFQVLLTIQRLGSSDVWVEYDLGDKVLRPLDGQGVTYGDSPYINRFLIDSSFDTPRQIELKLVSAAEITSNFIDKALYPVGGYIDENASVRTDINSIKIDINSINLKTLPQHPYNGTDVFGNSLSVPRTNKVSRVQRYTNNI